jgi:hypothetical protein
VTEAILLGMLDRTCTLIGRSQSGAVDRYNQPTWVETTTTGVECYIEQTDTREITNGRTTGIASHLGVFPSGTGIDDSDKVVLDDVTYEVLGPPWSVWEPGAGESHIEANLRVVE